MRWRPSNPPTGPSGGSDAVARHYPSETQRIKQSNEVAAIVIEQMAKYRPDVFVTLDLRYGIADAVWNAGIRRDV